MGSTVARYGHPHGSISCRCNLEAIASFVRLFRITAADPRVWKMRMLVIASVAVLLLVAELLARSAGLHTPVLYQRTSYGYRVAPDQSLDRFGKAVAYNAQGLRSAPLAVPAEGEVR